MFHSETKPVSQQRVCEIQINNNMKNLLQFWRANQDIQPVFDPDAIIENILSYVTKIQ